MSKKLPSTTVSKVSSSSSPATSKTAAQKSSILRSSFSPSRFQLRLFASVIQGFESQQLRVHDTSNNKLRCQHTVRPGAKVTCLDWGRYGNSQSQQSTKKRKREQSSSEDAVIAYGTDSSHILLFSPSQNKVVSELTGGHERGVRDFKFALHNRLEAWSVGGDGKLIQWNLNQNQPIRTISLPDTSANVLAPLVPSHPQIFCASATPYSIDLEDDQNHRVQTYDSFKSPAHTLFASAGAEDATTEAFLAVDSNRYINVYDVLQKKLSRSLIAGSEVVAGDLYTPDESDKDVSKRQMLALLTGDGTIELFSHPFVQQKQVNGDLTSSRKNLTRKATARVQITTAGSKRVEPISMISLQGPELLVALVDGGVGVSFQRVRWQDEDTGELLFDGLKQVARTKSASSLNSATVNGVKDVGNAHLDESRVVASNGGTQPESQSDAIEISSSDDEDADDEDEEEEDIHEDAKADNQADEEEEVETSDEDEQEHADTNVIEATASVAEDAEMADVDASTQEPSFGEMLASKHPTTISISDHIQPESSLVPTTSMHALALPTGMSLGTVLTQALRTNDRSLLESCLHTTDTTIIQNTIHRLPSQLAASLLSKLADRLASRPGRYGHLITWVQYICIAHGGAIASLPDVSTKLSTLYGVLTQRAKSLDGLLLLKGKLDMLDVQLAFRRQMQTQRGMRKGNDGEPGMIYIEGEKDNWDSEDDVDEAADIPRATAGKGKRPVRDLEDLVDEDDDEEDDEDMPLVNGVNHSSDNEEEEESDEEQERDGLVDIQAIEEGSESGDDVNDSEDEEGEDEDEEEDSEMDSFINDDSVSEVEGENDAILDAAPEESEEEQEVQHKPKKVKRH